MGLRLDAAQRREMLDLFVEKKCKQGNKTRRGGDVKHRRVKLLSRM
jgi:hypothetical protein